MNHSIKKCLEIIESHLEIIKSFKKNYSEIIKKNYLVPFLFSIFIIYLLINLYIHKDLYIYRPLIHTMEWIVVVYMLFMLVGLIGQQHSYHISNICLISCPIFSFIMKLNFNLFSQKENGWTITGITKCLILFYLTVFFLIALSVSLLARFEIDKQKFKQNSDVKNIKIIQINIVIIGILLIFLLTVCLNAFHYIKQIDNNNIFAESFGGINFIIALMLAYMIYQIFQNEVIHKINFKDYKILIIPLIMQLMSMLIK